MTDLSARIVRLEQIAATLHGKVLSADHDVAEISVPADLGGAFASMIGASGFSGYIIGQDVRQAPKRVVNMDYQTIVSSEMITQAYYRFKVELQDRHAKVFDPLAAVAGITRQVNKP